MSGCRVTKHLKNNKGTEERETEGAPNGDLVGSASVNCENCISVSSFCLSGLQPLQINLTNFVKAGSQSSRLSKCDKQAAKSIMTKPFPF